MVSDGGGGCKTYDSWGPRRQIFIVTVGVSVCEKHYNNTYVSVHRII